ncbi:hypothetical protein ASD03_26085 [Ensifer sp. Root127]|nr:hypothetical protein ASD03_26085 [Ensifer sp. Root127]
MLIDDRQEQVSVQVGNIIGHSSFARIEVAEHDRPSSGLESVRRYRICKGSQFGTDFASLMLSQCKLECRYVCVIRIDAELEPKEDVGFVVDQRCGLPADDR